MTETSPRRTPLYSCHVAHNARLVDFAGWEMPIQYKGIVAEHKAVREAVGLFDVSHMGRVEIEGKTALACIQHWVTNDVASLTPGTSLYTPICNHKGGIVDDCLVYCLAEHHFLIVLNASNRDKDYRWFCDNIPKGAEGGVSIATPDAGDKWALIAVQGPKARTLISRVYDGDLDSMGKNEIRFTDLGPVKRCGLATTGYTGEDGFEIMVPAEQATTFWDMLMEKGEDLGVAPIGLGARDTLRMEMRYPLYGNDIDDTTTPLEAGLKWTVKPDKGNFIGKEAIIDQFHGKPPRRLVGFEMKERGIPRHGYTLYSMDGEELGPVTSGGFAPSLQKAIGIGYVPAKPQYAKIGSTLQIEVRGKRLTVEVVKTPFYRP